MTVGTNGVLAGKTVIEVSARPYHTCVLTSEGKVACWGSGYDGQLGNGGTSDSPWPVAVDTSGALAGKTVIQVSAGSSHTCALTSDGLVACWGGGWSGQLGNGGTANSPWPMAVNNSGVLAGKTVTQVSAGSYHTCALTSDGQVACWGSSLLGNGSTESSSVPVAVDTSGVLAGKTVTQVSAGTFHTCALTSDGQAACWGWGSQGQLGNGGTSDALQPMAVNSNGVLTQVSAGAQHTCALTGDSKVVCWGKGEYGQLGNGGTANSPWPMAVNNSGVLAGKTVTQVSAGEIHTCAVTGDGKVACWGSGYAGQLGNGGTADSSVPVAVVTSGVLAGKTVSQISAGGEHTMAITTEAVPFGLTALVTVGNKIYDGNTAGVLTGCMLFPPITGVDCDISAASAQFADANSGIGKTVTVTGITPGGVDAGDYTLINPTVTTTADILKATATVTLGNLQQTYTGLPLVPTVTTSPAGLSYSLTGAPQTNAGSYPVSAGINDPNYLGVPASGIFVITQAQQALVSIYTPASAFYQQSWLSVFGYGGSGTGAFTYSSAGSTACSVDSSTGALTITSGTGTCQVSATRLGDLNYLPASSATGTITINKAQQATLTVSATPPTFFSGGPGTTLSAAGGSSGAVSYSVSGATGGLNCVITGSTLTATGGAGSCSVTATMAGNANYEPVTSVLEVPVKEMSRLEGISTRGQVGTGDNVLIGGFIIEGTEPRQLLIRAIGPSMGGAGVPDILQNPQISLMTVGGSLVASNDDWQTNANAGDISARGLAPADTREAALLMTLEPNTPYTPIVSGVGGSTGVGLVEVYDVGGSNTGSRLKGISTRGQVGSGAQQLIGGFIISGAEPKQVLIRAIGPSMSSAGVSGTLANPRIALTTVTGTPVASNDDWQSNANAGDISAKGLAPSNPLESALLITLQPNTPYTPIVSGVGGVTGVGLVEVYEVVEP